MIMAHRGHPGVDDLIATAVTVPLRYGAEEAVLFRYHLGVEIIPRANVSYIEFHTHPNHSVLAIVDHLSGLHSRHDIAKSVLCLSDECLYQAAGMHGVAEPVWATGRKDPRRPRCCSPYPRRFLLQKLVRVYDAGLDAFPSEQAGWDIQQVLIAGYEEFGFDLPA